MLPEQQQPEAGTSVKKLFKSFERFLQRLAPVPFAFSQRGNSVHAHAVHTAEMLMAYRELWYTRAS